MLSINCTRYWQAGKKYVILNNKERMNAEGEFLLLKEGKHISKIEIM